MEVQRAFGDKHPVLALLLMPFVVIAALVAKLFSKPIHRTPESIVAILQRRLSDAPDWHEWDDFICVPISDKLLDKVRVEGGMIDPREQEPPVFLSAEDRTRVLAIVEELQRSNNSFKPTPLRGAA
jgi:hypothetical protein